GLELRLLARRDHYAGTFARECFGDGRTDPSAAAGHDRDLAFEPLGHGANYTSSAACRCISFAVAAAEFSRVLNDPAARGRWRARPRPILPPPAPRHVRARAVRESPRPPAPNRCP